MRTFWKLSAPVVVMAGIFVSTGLAGEGSAPPSRRTTTPPSVAVTNHGQLQLDADMTQRMSTPNAAGPMQAGKIRDAQLAHSSDPAFVARLEQHQREIDRMLARQP
jgi:hypothetical protein